VFIQFFVLLNMSIAVVAEYYVKVKRDLDVRHAHRRTDNTLIVQSRFAVFMRRLGVNLLSVLYDGDSLGLMGWFPTGRRFRKHDPTDEEKQAEMDEDAAETEHGGSGRGSGRGGGGGGGGGVSGRTNVGDHDVEGRKNAFSGSRRRSSLLRMWKIGGGKLLMEEKAMRDVRRHFECCPSNWEVSEYAPWVLRSKKERWIERVRKDRRRGVRKAFISGEDGVSSQKMRVTPAHKLWWWMVHHIAKQARERRFMLVGHKAKEEVRTSSTTAPFNPSLYRACLASYLSICLHTCDA
jgi:hypothetical protein